MKIEKSSRHQKITGDFGEYLLLYLLSRDNFECVRVDHTGIDIIASNPSTKEVMGISVKARSRDLGRGGTSLSVKEGDFIKVKTACDVFRCVPYFAFVVDEDSKIYVFVIPMDYLQQKFPNGNWPMTKKHIEVYYNDKKIRIFEFNYKNHNWW